MTIHMYHVRNMIRKEGSDVSKICADRFVWKGMNINMEHKNIVATIYLKDGKAIKARDNYEEYPDVIELAKLYNDSGIDKIMIFDLSTTDEEHERNIQVIRNINRNIEIKVCAGGNINRMEDIKKFIYAGCLQVIVNGSKPESMARLQRQASVSGKTVFLFP